MNPEETTLKEQLLAYSQSPLESGWERIARKVLSLLFFLIIFLGLIGIGGLAVIVFFFGGTSTADTMPFYEVIIFLCLGLLPFVILVTLIFAGYIALFLRYKAMTKMALSIALTGQPTWYGVTSRSIGYMAYIVVVFGIILGLNEYHVFSDLVLGVSFLILLLVPLFHFCWVLFKGI
jgi:hypothetical protein